MSPAIVLASPMFERLVLALMIVSILVRSLHASSRMSGSKLVRCPMFVPSPLWAAWRPGASRDARPTELRPVALGGVLGGAIVVVRRADGLPDRVQHGRQVGCCLVPLRLALQVSLLGLAGPRLDHGVKALLELLESAREPPVGLLRGDEGFVHTGQRRVDTPGVLLE